MDTSKDLIAVITTAILAMAEAGKNTVIKSIKRTTNSASNWAFAGRRKRSWK